MTPRELFDADPETADCERCSKTVQLQADPPCDCGVAICDTCPPHDCEPCPTCDGAGEVFGEDPADPPYGYHATPCPDCSEEKV